MNHDPFNILNDFNQSINSVELFNLTNNGRLKPAKRDTHATVKNFE